jgi:methionyl-tRNA formyltransferase
MVNYDNFSDKDWIERLTKNDPEAIVSFFYKKQLKLFVHNLYKIFPYKVEIMDFVNELYLYL